MINKLIEMINHLQKTEKYCIYCNPKNRQLVSDALKEFDDPHITAYCLNNVEINKIYLMKEPTTKDLVGDLKIEGTNKYI